MTAKTTCNRKQHIVAFENQQHKQQSGWQQQKQRQHTKSQQIQNKVMTVSDGQNWVQFSFYKNRTELEIH